MQSCQRRKQLLNSWTAGRCTGRDIQPAGTGRALCAGNMDGNHDHKLHVLASGAEHLQWLCLIYMVVTMMGGGCTSNLIPLEALCGACNTSSS